MSRPARRPGRGRSAEPQRCAAHRRRAGRPPARLERHVRAGSVRPDAARTDRGRRRRASGAHRGALRHGGSHLSGARRRREPDRRAASATAPLQPDDRIAVDAALAADDGNDPGDLEVRRGVCSGRSGLSGPAGRDPADAGPAGRHRRHGLPTAAGAGVDPAGRSRARTRPSGCRSADAALPARGPRLRDLHVGFDRPAEGRDGRTSRHAQSRARDGAPGQPTRGARSPRPLRTARIFRSGSASRRWRRAARR